ncbi:isoprenylcysteine carboxylmethyltransferase family protein [Geobacillus proteiniphilus]|uniref:Isoprenylcysteine carboxylmethyltransferase family protein n=1 Tax=Geobacillus proteiniphilus TaxID=860353 RepID=A0ABY9MB77_9BACL|nr:isoprenylcysteine carboxylmethyltransferase family protein [Geobacillus proteiniphilus]WMJ15271.1 isoprenylcysteine carboxylmethyltransferase family protein [Geobacillus proteiniphilus]
MIVRFLFVFLAVSGMRVIELRLAKRNEQYVKALGAREFGACHYPLIVLMHVGFFLSLAVEALRKGARPPLLFPFFLAVEGLRVWTILSLGRFWNTKILIVPNGQVVKKGPYRWLRHPNYVVVALEIALLPLLFQAPITALVFSLLNAFLLSIRIAVEERALAALTDYREVFRARPRFLPRLSGGCHPQDAAS